MTTKNRLLASHCAPGNCSGQLQKNLSLVPGTPSHSLSIPKQRVPTFSTGCWHVQASVPTGMAE